MRASVSAIVVAALLFPVASCGTQESGVGPKNDPAVSRAGSSPRQPPCPQKDPNIFRCTLPRSIQADTPQEKRLLAAVQSYNDAYHTGDLKTVKGMQSRHCLASWWEEGGPRGVRDYDSYGEPPRITAFKAHFGWIYGEGDERVRVAYVAYAFDDPRLDAPSEEWMPSKGGWETC